MKMAKTLSSYLYPKNWQKKARFRFFPKSVFLLPLFTETGFHIIGFFWYFWHLSSIIENGFYIADFFWYFWNRLLYGQFLMILYHQTSILLNFPLLHMKWYECSTCTHAVIFLYHVISPDSLFRMHQHHPRHMS